VPITKLLLKIKELKIASLNHNQGMNLNLLIAIRESSLLYFKRFAGLVKAINFITATLTPPHGI
jgi:hypothetical protein